MARLLVTGASGLLGMNLALEAQTRHAVTGVDRCKAHLAPFELLCADLADKDALERVIQQARPDWIVHCAALANLEACEADPQLAMRLNADLPGEVAAACSRHAIRLVHISTDSVFAGTKQAEYCEQDVPDPQGVYAATKLQGEQNVLAADPRAAVARVNFFGWSPGGRRSLSEFFFNNLSAGEPCNGFTDIWFCPIFVGDLANILLEMLEKELAGLFHAVGSQALTKFDFGVRLARRFGFDESLVRPVSIESSGLTARRSPILRLSVHKLSTSLGRDIPDVSTGLDGFYTQFQQGYPQKIHSYQQAQAPERTS